MNSASSTANSRRSKPSPRSPPMQADGNSAREAPYDLSPDDREHLFAYYLATVDAEWPKSLEALKAARGRS